MSLLTGPGLPCMDIVMDGLDFGESLRFHEGRVWVADWARGQVWSADPVGGGRRLEAAVASFPLCFDHAADGSLLLLDNGTRRLLRQGRGGDPEAWVELVDLATTPWNEVIADARGGCYLDNIGFDFPGGEFAPGRVVHVAADGTARTVAEDLAFPNGMALTRDGRTLLVAESYAECVTAYDVADDGALSGRRVWAATPGEHPDGICLDSEGALWVADVGRGHCLRLREGGEVLAEVVLDRGAFDCVLSTDPQRPRLFVVGQDWGGESRGASGLVAAYDAPAPA